MNCEMRPRLWMVWMMAVLFGCTAAAVRPQDAHFHNAPVSTRGDKNPFAGNKDAIEAGAKIYADTCAKCHGVRGQGTGNIPAINEGSTQRVPDGEVFWFVTTGDPQNGMPAWTSLSEEQRWQVVSFVKTLMNSSGSTPMVSAEPMPAPKPTKTNAPPAAAPFTDFRVEQPGTVRKITVKDLPPPGATPTSDNGPKVVARPADAWPVAPEGFKVQLYATKISSPRLIRTAPNGDFFVAASDDGKILVFRGITDDGKPKETGVFATGLKRPYGIAFYPPGDHPQWVYIGETNKVVRFAYKSGDMKASGAPEHIADLPHGGGHWTRDVEFTPDGKKMFVAVGSASNVDDPDTTPGEKNRADILEFNPDGSGMRVYAYGIRNAGGGMAINPKTNELWCSVNERDGLGDNLVPDYITHVEDGGFYGWPWWYMGSNQDPRHKGKHPELKDKVLVPDVLLQPHNASLQIAFYEGSQFPEEFKDDLFAAEHGSWNKSVRAGYEVIRVPMHHTGRASGEYVDFITGFVVDNGHVWGRPVGITVASDGSLLFTDDGSNSIWRVVYTGAKKSAGASETGGAAKASE